MTGRRDGPAIDGADVPTTVLLGRHWSGAGRSVRRLAASLSRQLAHDVVACDVEQPDETRRRVRAIVERGRRRLVLLPVILHDASLSDSSRSHALTQALEAYPLLRVHRGRPPATDDIARILGDRARHAARSLPAAHGHQAEIMVVLATGAGANPASNADVSRLARLVYEAGSFGDVTCAFVGLTTPSIADVVARAARLGARGVVVVPHVLFEPRTRRRIANQTKAAGFASRVDVAVARTLDTHPGLVWAILRRHLEALTEPGLDAPNVDRSSPWVNPALRCVLEHTHAQRPGADVGWERRIAQLLPPRYRDGGFAVSSAPMAAAPLQRDADGSVAWDQMWQGFCELALAGGPPHRGTLLEAVSPAAALADPQRYAEVHAELARALRLVTGLPVVVDGAPGWIGVICADEEMAIWLMRAIVVENVMVRREGSVLYLPVGCHFTLEGEIKNVVTAVAKTYHYWREHQASRGT